jgi:hypothetical protein
VKSTPGIRPMRHSQIMVPKFSQHHDYRGNRDSRLGGFVEIDPKIVSGSAILLDEGLLTKNQGLTDGLTLMVAWEALGTTGH